MNLPQLLELDYINIQELPQLRSIIQSYHHNIDVLVKQLQELGNLQDREKREYRLVRDKMDAMARANQEKKKDYRSAIQGKFKKYETGKDEIRKHHEQSLKALQSKHSQQTLQLNQTLKSLQTQYQSLQPQQAEQSQYLSQIKQKSSSLISLQYSHHDNMNKQELKQLEQNRALFQKNKNMIKQLKRDVKMEAGRIVYQEKYENQDRNYQLKCRLFQLQERVARLRKDRNQIVKGRNQMKINVSLNEEEVEEYKAVGSIQKSKIKLYGDKVEALKKTISAEISKLETKVKEKKNKWENELKGSKLRLFNLEDKKEELRVNLEKYKLLGETILMQREEVQEFFLMAIEACKKEAAQSEGAMENEDKQYGEKVDIDELLPKDKLRIITNLYTKLALAPSK